MRRRRDRLERRLVTDRAIELAAIFSHEEDVARVALTPRNHRLADDPIDAGREPTELDGLRAGVADRELLTRDLDRLRRIGAARDRERDLAVREWLVIAAEQAHRDANWRTGHVLDRVAVDVEVAQIRILDQPADRVLPQLRVLPAIVATLRRRDEAVAPQRFGCVRVCVVLAVFVGVVLWFR